MALCCGARGDDAASRDEHQATTAMVNPSMSQLGEEETEV